ncbi:hypothetical protein DERF_007851 [Dermatophagoides farinae]|uniref:Uncharacterized protein n=1 Tax=Dermatophagoides farinae TaxID=6954 RepID=A0A922HZT6_DERFA|nr:hypothetical protein DERF_007851 [Dermatophagoides farinae]
MVLEFLFHYFLSGIVCLLLRTNGKNCLFKKKKERISNWIRTLAKNGLGLFVCSITLVTNVIITGVNHVRLTSPSSSSSSSEFGTKFDPNSYNRYVVTP